jgi:hypothetical protein
MKRNHQPDLSLVSQIDWARLAAYIDGEGCIRIAGNKGSTPYSRRVLYLEITITNTDVRLGEWLIQRFGGSVYINKRNGQNPKWSPAVAWVVGARHASKIIEYCLPYFIIKREQADVALAFQATIITDRRYGCKGRPQELLDRQQAMREQLQTLKGTSSRARRTAVTLQ